MRRQHLTSKSHKLKRLKTLAQGNTYLEIYAHGLLPDEQNWTWSYMINCQLSVQWKAQEWKKCCGSLYTFQQNKLLAKTPEQITQTSKQTPKPESRTCGLCYCTHLKWHPTVHRDSNRISRRREKTDITCCALSQDSPSAIIFIRCHCPLSPSLSACPPALLWGHNTHSQTNLPTSNNQITSTMYLSQCQRKRGNCCPMIFEMQ